MKKLLLTTLLLNVLMLQAQPFEKSYPYFSEAYGDLVFVHENGYTLAGLGLSAGKYSLYLIHTDMNGDTIFTKHLDYGIRSLGIVRSVTDSEDNHYISFFDADSANLVKFAPDWQEVWKKKFDFASRIYQLGITSDGNLLVSATGEYPYLIKLDTAGNIIWQSNPIHVYYPEYSRATSMAETSSGDIMLSIHYPTGWGWDPYPRNTIKLFSSTGMLIDSGEIVPHPQYSCGVLSSNIFGDHLISLCYTGRGQSYLVHHEPNGNIIRQKEITIAGHGLYPSKYVINNNNDIVVIGNGNDNIGVSYSESIIYGMNMEGDSLWMRIRNYPATNYPYCITLCSDGGYAISGGIKINGFFQPYLLKTDPWGGNSPLAIRSPEQSDGLRVYPNPAIDRVVFESSEPLHGIISIIDMSGRKVASFRTTGLKTEWHTGGLKPGMYFYKIENKGDILTGRLIIGL